MNRTVHHKFGKKLFLSLALAALATVGAHAQGITGYLGATLGPQYTTIRSDRQTFTGGIAYNAAVSAELRFSQQVGIEGQFGLSTLNANTKYKDSISYNDFVMRYDNNYTFNTEYFQGHLLFKYYIRLGTDPITPYDRPEGSGNYLYFIGGPYVAFISQGNSPTHVGRTGTSNTQAHINNTTDTAGVKLSHAYDGNSVQEEQDKTVMTPFDYGFTVGAGLSLRLSQSASLDFSLRFSDGLATIDNPDPTLTVVKPTLNTTQLIYDGFFLGHNILTVDQNVATIHYTPANAYNMFIAFNIGLKFKLFGDTY